jgi:nicotinate-nucleotide pyrophosphorylase (carboxylating)
MNREELIELAYQRGKELNLSNASYRNKFYFFITTEYSDDLYPWNDKYIPTDITTTVISKDLKRDIKAMIKAKDSGIIAGVEEISWFYKHKGIDVKVLKNDGDEIKRGDLILELYGREFDIISTERTVLNVLQRMSGIATQTRRLKSLIKDYKTKIAATRKTLFGFLDKKAVYLGGGLTHRLNLCDSILIKDNHLEIIKKDGIKNPVEEALERVNKYRKTLENSSSIFIEVEVTNKEDALIAAKKFKKLKLKNPCIIMLDNMKPSQIEEIIRELKERKLYKSVLLEASGGITESNIIDYAKTGVDVVSLGALTHSVKALDISLELI